MEFSLPKDNVAFGREMEASGRKTEAIKAYQVAIKENASNEVAWRALGELYFKMGEKGYAVQCFEQVLRMNPKDNQLEEWVRKMKSK